MLYVALTVLHVAEVVRTSCVVLQGQLKESNMGADEAVRAKLETAAKLKDLEKKVRTLEQDLNQAQEVSDLPLFLTPLLPLCHIFKAS